MRGQDAFVLQSVVGAPNNYLMELLIFADALKRASARSIHAVIPYYGYCRQDRKDRPRVPITAKLVADLLQCAGVTRLLTADLHAGQIQGFFDIPVDNVPGRRVLVEEVRALGLGDLVVVATDIGSGKMARDYAAELGGEVALVEKVRRSASSVAAATLIGEVAGRDVLLADDMCSTGGTLVSAAQACREKGARRIVVAVTHGLFVLDAVEKIEESPIELLLVTDTIPRPHKATGASKIRYVSIAHLLAEAIDCVVANRSLTPLCAVTPPPA